MPWRRADRPPAGDGGDLEALVAHTIGVLEALGARAVAIGRLDAGTTVPLAVVPVQSGRPRIDERLEGVVGVVARGAPEAAAGEARARLVVVDGRRWGVVAACAPSDSVAQLAPALEHLTAALALHVAGEERRAGAERRAHLILDSVADGVFGVDADGRATFINPAGAAMLGLEPARIIGRHTHPLINHSHADGTALPAEGSHLLAAVRAGVQSFRDDEVFWRPDGSSFPVAYTITPVRDGTGSLGAVVTFRDITERQRTERRLLASEERFRALTQHAPVGIFQVATDGGFTYVSERWCAITGCDALRALGGGWLDGVHPADRERVSAAWQAAVAERRPLASEHRHECAQRGTVWVLFDAVPLWGDDGAAAGFIGTITDVTSRRAAEEQARTDPLTGLANRRAFHEALAEELVRADRLNTPLALLMLDLDHFKEVNDVHGHGVGDRVLVEAADRLRSVARERDTLARVGGEEFVWLLPETGREGALAAAERARREIAARPFPTLGALTISVGIAAAAPGATDGDQLLSRADQALYRAKRAGRDTVSE